MFLAAALPESCWQVKKDDKTSFSQTLGTLQLLNGMELATTCSYILMSPREKCIYFMMGAKAANKYWQISFGYVHPMLHNMFTHNIQPQWKYRSYYSEHRVLRVPYELLKQLTARLLQNVCFHFHCVSHMPTLSFLINDINNWAMALKAKGTCSIQTHLHFM